MMRNMYDDNRNKSNMKPEEGHPADETKKEADVDTMNMNESEKKEKAITVNNEAVDSSETDDEMELKAIESEQKIERGITNARSIVDDLYRDCYATHSNIRDSSERALYSWLQTISVSILVSGGFLEDVLLKRPDEDAPDKQPTGTDSKKSRDDKLDSLSDVDGSTPGHEPDLV